MIRRNLALRLALVYGLVSVLVVVGLGLGIYSLTTRTLRGQAQDGLAALGDFYAAYTAATAPDEVRLAALAPQIAGFFAPQSDYDLRLFARSGSLLAATRDLGPLPSRAAQVLLSQERPVFFLVPSQDLADRLYVARPIAGAEGNLLAVVEVSRNLAEIESFLAVLRLALGVAGGLLLLAALGASLLLARQIARPLAEMESATRAIAAGDFSRRLEVARQDEIGRLALSINQMATDLARLEASRRDFIARISHDLRTPLTAIKGFVVNLQDSAPDEFQPSLSTMDEQTDRLIRLVNDLLLLSRLQRGELHLRRGEVDLAAVAVATVSLASARAQRLGMRLIPVLDAGLPPVWGDADRLQQVTVNLLDNALRATPSGGTIEVVVRLQDGEVYLVVVDDGAGLTAAEAERAFEAYYRGPGGGAGLGLTIAREIVEAHGGHIWLRPRQAGGAEAGFALPLPEGAP
jgi:signal transduction histidine kinase